MPRATRTVNERKVTWLQVRKLDGTLWATRDRLAGKAARTRWINRLGKEVGTVLNEWTEGDGRPQPQWVTDDLARREREAARARVAMGMQP